VLGTRPCHLHETLALSIALAGQTFPMSILKSSFLTRPSFLQTLRDAAEAAREATAEDPWEPPLRKLKGRVAADGVERVSTNDVFDVLEVPMRRRASQTVRLSKLMRRLGWSNIRARGLNPGSYRDRVRGFAREVPGHPATLRRPNEF
jgi:hypothetical protein